MTGETQPARSSLAVIHAGWRFVLGVLVTIFAIYGSAYLVVPFRPSSEYIFEAAYRPLVLFLLLAGFYLLGRFLDLDEKPIATMGLGMSRPWLKEWWIGAVSGAGMIGLAVLFIKLFGDYHGAVLDAGTLGSRLLNRDHHRPRRHNSPHAGCHHKRPAQLGTCNEQSRTINGAAARY